MKVRQKTEGGKTFFLVSELDPLYQKAVNDLGFVEADEGFGRVSKPTRRIWTKSLPTLSPLPKR